MDKKLDAPRRGLPSAACLDVVAAHAGAVDTDARFPAEAIACLKSERLLGAMVPAELGGASAGLFETADACSLLGQACSSTAMIFAMHNIKLHGLVAAARTSAWHRDLCRKVAERQLLLASATTEAGIGGDLRNSVCAVVERGSDFELTKDATVISYARAADAIFATARRNPEAASGDQVMVALMQDQYTLKPTTSWETLGMRGTCSEGFILSGRAPREQIFPQPFAELAAQSMLASAHILWGSVWYGIAAGALSRAHQAVRAEARRRSGVTPPSATPLAEANARLQMMRAAIAQAIEHFENAESSADYLGSVRFAVAMNNLKISASQTACDVVLEALRIAGIQGYRNDSPYSMGRQLRDVLSAPLMVANDRIVSNLASLLPVSRIEPAISG